MASYNTIFPNKETERIERKGVLLSWRWLYTDPDDIGFDIYRKEGNYKFQKINKTPIINSYNYKDLTANINKMLKYEDVYKRQAHNQKTGVFHDPVATLPGNDEFPNRQTDDNKCREQKYPYGKELPEVQRCV